MRRAMLFLSLVALMMVAAFPVIAQNRFDNGGDRFDNGGDRFDNGSFFFNGNDDDDDFDSNGFFFNGNDDFDGNGVGQEIGNESESGDVNVEFSVSSEGDFAQQCVAPLQFGNTGNLQNAQGALQYQSTADDIEFEGSSFVFSPSVSTECDQAVQQSAAASS